MYLSTEREDRKEPVFLMRTSLYSPVKVDLTDEKMDIVSFSHYLSYSVILTSLFVKVPQILSVLNARSTKGLSLSSVLLEEIG